MINIPSSAFKGFQADAESGILLRQYVTVEHWRGGVLIERESRTRNLVTTEGRNKYLDSMWHNDAAATYYIGLKLAGAMAAGDTLAAHAGWTEFTDYTGNRQEYVEAAAVGGLTTNTASPAVFPITGIGAITGAFMASVATGAVGILPCGVDFAATKNVVSGDTINVTYECTAADDGV